MPRWDLLSTSTFATCLQRNLGENIDEAVSTDAGNIANAFKVSVLLGWPGRFLVAYPLINSSAEIHSVRNEAAVTRPLLRSFTLHHPSRDRRAAHRINELASSPQKGS